MQKNYYKKKFPIVHRWVLDLKDRLLKDLNLDFEETLKSIKKIYDLEGEASRKNSTVGIVPNEPGCAGLCATEHFTYK